MKMNKNVNSLTNCIYLCFATAEILWVIDCMKSYSAAYLNGLIWLFPICLLIKPACSVIRFAIRYGKETERAPKDAVQDSDSTS